MHPDTDFDSLPGSKYLRTPDAAQLLGLSPRTLEKHRTFGTGPTYRKLGGRIVYRVDDLRHWADRGVRQSTSDPGAGPVFAGRPLTAEEMAVGCGPIGRASCGERGGQYV